MSINLVEEELSVFKASASRMRWFISTAVLVSALIILHVYLEQYSFQTAQLEGVHGSWILTHRNALRKCYNDILKAIEKKPLVEEKSETENLHKTVTEADACQKNIISTEKYNNLLELSWKEFLADYSAKEYVFNIAENTYRKAELSMRVIPILGIQIPGNDFVIVMAVMSMVFVVGVWLSLRALETSLLSLAGHKRDDIMKIAQLNTVFLTISEFGDSTFATLIRTASLWLPFFSIVMATFLGYEPIFSSWLQHTDAYAGEKNVVLSFFYISILICCVHFLIAWQCDRAMLRIDAIFRRRFDNKQWLE